MLINSLWSPKCFYELQETAWDVWKEKREKLKTHYNQIIIFLFTLPVCKSVLCLYYTNSPRSRTFLSSLTQWTGPLVRFALCMDSLHRPSRGKMRLESNNGRKANFVCICSSNEIFHEPLSTFLETAAELVSSAGHLNQSHRENILLIHSSAKRVPPDCTEYTECHACLHEHTRGSSCPSACHSLSCSLSHTKQFSCIIVRPSWWGTHS